MQTIVDRQTFIFTPLTEAQQNRNVAIFARYSNYVQWETRPDVAEYKENLDLLIAGGIPPANLELAKSLVDMVLSKESSDPLADLVMNTLGENMYLLENVIASGPEEDKKSAMGVLLEMYTHKYLPPRTPPVFEQVRELLGRISDSDLHEAAYREREINIYMAYRNGDLDPTVADEIRDRFNCETVIDDWLEVAPEQAEFFEKSWLGALGIKDEDKGAFIDSWMTIKKEDGWEKRVKESCKRNISVMAELNEINPDIIGALFRDFGIVNFGRYPVEVLVDQYNNRNDTSQKYGVWVSAYADHNTALNNRESEDEVGVLWKQAKEIGLGLRIVEAGSRHEVVGRLFDLDRRYGENNNKIEFLVANAHGKKDRLNFGVPKTVGDGGVDGAGFSTRDFQRRLPEAIKRLFKVGFPVAFLACLADEGDMTKQFSIQWEGTVAQGAKEKITADGESLTILKVGEELAFDIGFKNTNKDDTIVAGGVYKDGQHIEVDHRRKLRTGYWKKAMSKMVRGDISGVWKNFVESVKRST